MSLLAFFTAPPPSEPGEKPSTLVEPYNTANYMTIPEVYAGQPGATHPDVIDMVALTGEQWNGWRYWMAFTPFHNAGSGMENPSIGVSNTPEGPFVTPPGVTNPLFPWQGTAWNSDTEIVYDPVGNRLGVIWRGLAKRLPDGTVETGEWMWVKWSSDGVNWTPEIDLWPKRDPKAGEILSPAFVREDDGSWTVFLHHGIRRWTAPDLTGPWTEHGWCSYSGVPSGSIVWHSNVIRHRGQYRMLAQVKVPEGAAGWRPDYVAQTGEFSALFPGVSTDGGKTFKFGNPIWPRYTWEGVAYKGFYRSAFLPSDNGADYDVWYSGTGSGWRIGHMLVPQRLWSSLG